LLSEMTVTRASLKILNSDVTFTDKLHTNASAPNSYKFFVPRSVDICTFKLTITRACNECKDINFYVQSHSLPTSKNYLHSTTINVSSTNDDVIEFYPHENSWHYVDINFIESVAAAVAPVGAVNSDATVVHKNSSFILLHSTKALNALNSSQTVQHIEYSVSIEFQMKRSTSQNDDDDGDGDENKGDSGDFIRYIPPMPKNRIFDEYPLLRQTYREFFMYDYDLVPDINGTVPIAINLTSRTPALMKFEIGDVYDIGGTLTFAIAMKSDITGSVIEALSTPSVHVDMNGEPAIAEKLTADDTKASNQTVIVCIRLNEPGE
jgi:transmembrane protein 8A/B